MIRRTPLSILSALAAATFFSAFAHADTYTWLGASGNWNDPAQWLNGTLPLSTSADQLVFPGGNYTTTIGSSHDPWTVNGITVAGAGAITINAGNTSGLRFDGASSFFTFSNATQNANVTVNAPVILAQPITVSSVPPSGTTGYQSQNGLTLSQSVSGPGGITVTSGSLTLAAANSFQGGVTLIGAPSTDTPQVTNSLGLYVGNANSLGTGILTLDSTNGVVGAFFSPGTYTNDVLVRGNAATISNYGTPTDPPATVALGNVIFASDSTLFLGNPIEPSLANISFQAMAFAGNVTLVGQPSYEVSIDPGVITEAGGPRTLTLQSGTFNLNHANNYTGGTVVSGGAPTVNANVAGALANGPISLSGTLTLNASGAANSTITGTNGSSVHYNANGAASGHSIAATVIAVASNVTSASAGSAADTFITLAGGSFSAPGNFLATLTRGTNLTLGDGSTLTNTDGGLPPVQNLGTNADLILGLAQNLSADLTLGTGTPWRGISSTGFVFNGNITANSNITFSGVRLGTSGVFNIPRATVQPVTVLLQAATLDSSLADYSGVDHFDVSGSEVTLAVSNALGGANGAAPVPLVDIFSLNVSNSTALNGNVTLHAGSTFTIDAPGLNGTGTILRDNQPITIALRDAQALSGTQLSPAFVQAGDTITVAASDVVGLNAVNPAAHFVVGVNLPSIQQGSGFNLNGGSFVLDGFGALVPGPTSLGDSAIRIGNAGEIFAATGVFYNGESSGGAAIEVPIIAQGPVAFGFANATPFDPSGAIILTSTANQFQSFVVNNIALVASSPQALTGANITVNGGLLALLSNATYGSPATLYSNPITVTANATIQDTATNISTIVSFPNPHAIALSSLSVGNATLTLLPTQGNLSLDTLNVTGNANLALGYTTTNMLIGSITHDGISNMSLTFYQTTSTLVPSFTIAGNIDVAGPITIDSHTRVEIDGTVSFDPTPLTVAGALMGNGTIHRDVLFSGGAISNLTPHRYGATTASTTPGTLTVDSLSLSPTTAVRMLLKTPNAVGGTADDLIAVASNLTLDGNLSLQTGAGFGPGSYTLFTYGGTLTDNGLTLPTIAGDTLALDLSTPGQVNLLVSVATPEPASLSLALPAALLLLNRRRRPV